MCSNYEPVTRVDRLLAFFGVVRGVNEPPLELPLASVSLRASHQRALSQRSQEHTTHLERTRRRLPPRWPIW